MPLATTDQSTLDIVRVDPRNLKRRLSEGEQFTILDVRSADAYEKSTEKMRGAIRVPPDDFPGDPPWPSARPTVLYCT